MGENNGKFGVKGLILSAFLLATGIIYFVNSCYNNNLANEARAQMSGEKNLTVQECNSLNDEYFFYKERCKNPFYGVSD